MRIEKTIDRHATVVTAPNGLDILEITDPDIAMSLIEKLGKANVREKILQVLASNGYLLKIAADPQEYLPRQFSEQLESVPNRGTENGRPCVEDTSQQETEFGASQNVRLEIVRFLAEGRNAISEVLRHEYNEAQWRRDHICDLIYRNSASDIGIASLSMATLALEKRIFNALVHDMRKITENIRHLKQRWGQEANGTVIVVPEQSICHRRNGSLSGQVIWHTDATGGIIFCQDKEMSHPRRMLFQKNGSL